MIRFRKNSEGQIQLYSHNSHGECVWTSRWCNTWEEVDEVEKAKIAELNHQLDNSF